THICHSFPPRRSSDLFKFPRLAVRFERLAEPVKGVRSDLGELPARRRPIGARAHLHNVLANSTTNLLLAMTAHRISPVNPPRLRSEEHTSELQSPCNI